MNRCGRRGVGIPLLREIVCLPIAPNPEAQHGTRENGEEQEPQTKTPVPCVGLAVHAEVNRNAEDGSCDCAGNKMIGHPDGIFGVPTQVVSPLWIVPPETACDEAGECPSHSANERNPEARSTAVHSCIIASCAQASGVKPRLTCAGSLRGSRDSAAVRARPLWRSPLGVVQAQA